MNKKQYQKPTIQVVHVNIQSHILAGSGGANGVNSTDGFRFRSGGFGEDDADY